MSIVSVRYKDLFFNSGKIIIDAETAGVLIFSLIEEPLNITDLVNTLNSATFVSETDGTTVLNTLFTFAVIADSQGVADTRIEVTNVTNADHQMDFSGNMQTFIGGYTPLFFHDSDVINLSDDNSLRIQYIMLKSDDINGEFQGNILTNTGSQNAIIQFDKGVLCVADQYTNFQYANKNLDVHMELQRQTPCRFYLVDQTGRPVNITYCFLEMLMYPVGFFSKTKIQRILKNGLRHEKEQQHLYLSSTQLNFQFSRTMKEIAISDVQGYVQTLSKYQTIYGIYCAQVSHQYPIAVIIVTANMVLQPQSRDIFLWDECQGSNVSQLQFSVKEYSNDLLTQTQVTTFPDMIVRLLIK